MPRRECESSLMPLVWKCRKQPDPLVHENEGLEGGARTPPRTHKRSRQKLIHCKHAYKLRCKPFLRTRWAYNSILSYEELRPTMIHTSTPMLIYNHSHRHKHINQWIKTQTCKCSTQNFFGMHKTLKRRKQRKERPLPRVPRRIPCPMEVVLLRSRTVCSIEVPMRLSLNGDLLLGRHRVTKL